MFYREGENFALKHNVLVSPSDRLFHLLPERPRSPATHPADSNAIPQENRQEDDTQQPFLEVHRTLHYYCASV